MEAAYLYEPLDVAVHDRCAFSCGSEPLDQYLRQQARRDMHNHVAAVYVQRTTDSPAILGYYTISTLAIEAVDLPSELITHVPRYPALPAALIGRLAVDLRHRGIGLGGLLLFDASRRSLRSGIASMAVVVDAKDGVASGFYERCGFRRFQNHPDRLFLRFKDIEAVV